MAMIFSENQPRSVEKKKKQVQLEGHEQVVLFNDVQLEGNGRLLIKKTVSTKLLPCRYTPLQKGSHEQAPGTGCKA